MKQNGRWWRSLVLTGASGGIGRALASELASNRVTMLLIGRDLHRLEATAKAARSKGASVQVAACDVTDTAAMARLLDEADKRAPVDLVIAAAGQSAGTATDGDRPEAPGTLHRIIDVNVFGAANAVEPLLAPMRARGGGRIVLIGSLAAHRPLPDMPAYSASKAALRAWGTALRGALAQHGVGVTIVSPGFVTSPMSARHLGARPFEVSAEDAARRIVRGVVRGDALVTFPAGLAALAWLGSRLPPRLSDFCARPFATRIASEGDAVAVVAEANAATD
ncbi:MAG: SDR family NAD(P)-dependent oxidoreductase [Pseudomonadota bacterium]